MATLLTLRRRIKAASNVAKATRAMQMIAAANLRKAQDAALSSRPYVGKLTILAKDVSGKVEEKSAHPYITPPGKNGKTLVIALSPDKGLCGGLITNLIREFFTYAKEQPDSSYVVMGKKLENQVIKLKNEVLASFVFGTTLPKFDAVFPIATLINDQYLSGNVTGVKVLYTDFNSIFSQTPKMTTLLPISLADVKIEDTQEGKNNFQLYEPTISEILPYLLNHYLEMALFQFMLESFLSEQAARMISMQNATNNAKDIIEGFRLEYNKTRQAKITSELLDITGGRTSRNLT
ncbi:MAG: ATP synthase F1 subunit gamma [Candidatus Levybacteria bacterium]|nr:ATP synthase F1 subunit gamma [Candidatus Levybacteria bacterium]